jgi:hypothetical protein
MNLINRLKTILTPEPEPEPKPGPEIGQEFDPLAEPSSTAAYGEEGDGSVTTTAIREEGDPPNCLPELESTDACGEEGSKLGFEFEAFE